MGSRNHVLPGISALALGVGLAAPDVAHAVVSCNNATIAGAVDSATWSLGNCSISSSGSVTLMSASGLSNGTLTNQGQISSTGTTFLNAGSIATLSNAVGGGIISTRSTGLVNNGSIGALSNHGTISGNASGAVMNYGTIGSLYNAGTISGLNVLHNHGTITILTNDTNAVIAGTTSAIRNDIGTILTLVNNGTITSATAIENAVSIGTITNNGTIAGSVHAIQNSLSGMGAITNSGVIAGDILNTSTSALTINGGTASYGTLTGYLTGSAGTITSTSSNLLFGSGLLLLNDDINVGSSHTVLNNGATLQLTSPRSITGNYAQTGGGLVFAVGGTTAALSVSGDATINNTVITISGTGLAVGSTFTIVRAGGTGTYLNDTGRVIGGNPMLAIVKASGNDLVATLTTYQLLGSASGQQGADLGRTLDQINQASDGAATQFRDQVLNVIDRLPADAQASAIKQLAPAQTAHQMVLNNTGAVLGAVERHQQTAMAYSGETGKAAGSDSADTGAWVQVLGGGAVRGANAEGAGYRSTHFGAVGGVYSYFTDTLMGGIAASWVRSEISGAGDSSGSTAQMDSYQLIFYGTYRQGQAFLDGQLGVGYNRLDQSRALPALGLTASADYDGHQYLARGEFGWDQPVGKITVTPLAGLRWVQSVSGAYTESGAGSANLSVDSHTTNSVTQDLGVKVSWNMPTRLGRLTPELRAAWLHDYTQGAIVTTGVMGGQVFATSFGRTAADGVQLGAVATLAGADNLSVRVEYEGEQRTKYQSHTGALKAIVDF